VLKLSSQAPLVLLALVCAPQLARAEANDVAAAEKLFREGAAALKRGEVEPACAKLSQSNTLDPAIGTLGLLALCHERQGRTATALLEYRTVASLARSANQNERAVIASTRARELEAKVPHLELVLPKLGAELTIEVGDRHVLPTELDAPIALDPGPVKVRVSADGYESWSQTLTVPAEGGVIRVAVPKLEPVESVSLEEDKPAAPAVARETPHSAPPPPPPAAPRPRSPGPPPEAEPSVLAWGAIGIGVAGLAVGAAFGVNALSNNSKSAAHCSGNECDFDGVNLRARALRSATVSTLSFVGGSAMLATGLVLLFTRDREQPRLAAEVSSRSDGGFVSLRGRF